MTAVHFLHSFRLQIFKFFFMILLAVFFAAIFSIEAFLVPAISEQADNELTNSTRMLTSAIHACASIATRNHLQTIAELNIELARYHHSLVEQGKVSREEAMKRMERILLSQPVGNSGYIYCLNAKGTVVVHPKKELIGTNVSRFSFVQKQMAGARGEEKTSYIEYNWQNPGETTLRAKAQYAVYFAPFDWIISVSAYRSEFYQLVNPGDLRKTILSQKFGRTGYAFMLSSSGEILIHPQYPNAQGLNLLEQKELSAEFIRTMLTSESGIIEYDWRNPGEQQTRKKIAVYENIPEYRWLVASTSYWDEIMHPVHVARSVAYGLTVLLVLATAVLSYILSGRLSQPVEELTRQINNNIREKRHDQLQVPARGELAHLVEVFNRYQRRIEEQKIELLTQQERFTILFDSCPDAVLVVDESMHILDCNNEACALFQGSQKALRGLDFCCLSVDQQSDGTSSRDKSQEVLCLVQENQVLTFEWLHKTLKGAFFPAEVKLKLLQKDIGDGFLFIAFIRDITVHREAMAALRRSEMNFQNLIESAADAIIIAQDAKIVFANAEAISMLGYPEKKILGSDFKKFIHSHDIDMVLQRHKRRLEGEEGVPQTYAFSLVREYQEELNVEMSTILIEWQGSPATFNLLRDITQQQKMTSVFEQAQKMEAIGTLAGGIAHDFNNLLMGVQGRISLLTNSGLIDDEGMEHIRSIEDHLQSATGLTRQLLGFARGGKFEPIPLDLAVVVKNSSTLFGRTKKGVQIHLDLHEAPVVEVDKSQFEQVLLNMYVNAWQAMPDGGQIRVGLETVALNAAFCSLYKVEAGSFAALSIADTGIGMDATVLERIFDPFFTTKHKRRGTGMGLASVYGIIQRHKGFITVESEVGKGSCFTLWLPLSTKRAEAVDEPIEEQRQSQKEREATILLVDDEEMILEIGVALLENLGYKAIPAQGGKKAVAMVESCLEGIDLIILDLVMPDLDGEKTLEAIRTCGCTAPVILSSGYSADGNGTKKLKKQVNGFLQKPFTMTQLSNTVRTALESASEPESTKPVKSA